MNTPEYIYFNVFSYKGDKYSVTYNDIVNKSNEQAISKYNANYNTCYALPIDKIIVTLDDNTNEQLGIYSKYSNTNVLWDFGDGTTSTELSAIHWYKFPGKYRITLTVYDKNFIPCKSKYNTIMYVYNYIPKETVIGSISAYDYTYGDIIYIEPQNLVDGVSYYIDTPETTFKLHKFNSWQSYNVLSAIGYDIQLYEENSRATYIDNTEYNSNAYSHLSCYCKIIHDDIITSHIHFDNTNKELYINYNSTTSSFVTCLSSDNNATLAGTYDNTLIKIVDELPSTELHDITIGAVFDTTGFKTSENVDSTLLQQWYNYVPVTYKYNTVLSSMLSTINISTFNFINGAILNVCGLQGEQYNIFDYNIVNIPIQFVYRLTFNNTPVKWIHNFTLSADGTIYNPDLGDGVIGNLRFSAQNEPLIIGDDVIIESNNISSDVGGILQGYIKFTKPYQNILMQIHLNCFDSEINNKTYKSAVFDVIDTPDNIKLFKINENFDLAQKYKDIRKQPILQESDNFFDSILGQIVGDNTDYNNLGVRIYEKIANFVLNTQDIDTCNVSFLYDMYNKFDEFILDANYDWPVELQRLIDLLSIKFDKLLGNNNTFNSDFDKRGLKFTTKYGKNLGKQISFENDTISTNETIVAYEKFGQKYIKLNCNIDNVFISAYSVDSIQPTTSYYLSGYTDTISAYQISPNNRNDNRCNWGWSLILPDVGTFNINDYYTFYRYNNIIDGSIHNNVIDWSNEFATNSAIIINDDLTLAKWNKYKKLYLYSVLCKGLDILSANTNIN